jgi:hypothetical protein
MTATEIKHIITAEAEECRECSKDTCETEEDQNTFLVIAAVLERLAKRIDDNPVSP